MNILVGYDGTNAAREAIALAEQHARVFDAKIILACSMVGGPEVPRRDFETAENFLEHAKIDLIDKKVTCAQAYFNRGLCNYRLGNYRQAKDDLEAAALLGCKDALFWSKYETKKPT